MIKTEQYYNELKDIAKQVIEMEKELNIKKSSTGYFTELLETKNLFTRIEKMINKEIKILKTDHDLNIVDDDKYNNKLELLNKMLYILNQRKEVI